MTQITWSHTCTVGVRAMDDQHGILLDALNEIRLAILHGLSREILCKLLGEYKQFSTLHFLSEERLMEQSNFARLQAHRLEHQRILRALSEAAGRFQHDDRVQMQPLLCSMRDDFLRHIEVMDQEYSRLLNQRGID